MANDFNFDGGRVFKAGNDVTPADIADSLMESIEENPEEIEGVIVVVKRFSEKGTFFEVGYTTDSVDAHVGRLDVAKDIIKGKFFGKEE